MSKRLHTLEKVDLLEKNSKFALFSSNFLFNPLKAKISKLMSKWGKMISKLVLRKVQPILISSCKFTHITDEYLNPRLCLTNHFFPIISVCVCTRMCACVRPRTRDTNTKLERLICKEKIQKIRFLASQMILRL